MKIRTLTLGLAAAVLTACGGGSTEGGNAKVVNIYNYSDYIAEDTIANFEKATGIKATYDVFDSDEMVEAKLLAGDSGYDVVVPTLNFFGRQIEAGVFLPLDKSKIPNLANLDPDVMARIAGQDPGNMYGVPYMIGTTGIGYNVAKLKERFGEDTQIGNSWDLVFKPQNIAKMKDCGVTLLDTPADMIPIARPYVQNFHSSQYVSSLANGSTCLVVGWSGDILQARDRAVEADNGVEVAYTIPVEGAPQWFDMLAIPRDAKNPESAYAYINYLLEPQVAANNTNFVTYANPVTAATPLVEPEISGDPAIYPSEEARAKMFTFAINSPQTERLYTRLWTEIKTGR
jgi:putrescine transport system substrate-binding protein